MNISGIEQGRSLDDLVIVQATWRQATEEVLTTQAWDAQKQAVRHGMFIADAVILGVTTTQDVKEMRDNGNLLDKEAVARAGGRAIEAFGLDSDDYREALARRIFHHSGKIAFGLVKSHRHRRLHWRCYNERTGTAQYVRDVGMGSREAKDYALE